MEKSWNVGTNLRDRIGAEATESQLRYHSLTFIRTLKSIKGHELTEQVVDAVSNILGDDWAGNIIADLLIDTNDPTVSRIFLSTAKLDEKIQLIKTVRAASAMGLKDTKDAVEAYIFAMTRWQEEQRTLTNRSYFGWYDVLTAPYLEIILKNRFSEDGDFDDAWFNDIFIELRTAGWKVIR